jgi:hypothetical protein
MNTSQPSARCGPRRSRRSTAGTSITTSYCWSRSRCSAGIRRSRSAAKADRHCVVPPASATPGIRSAATTFICSTPCRATARHRAAAPGDRSCRETARGGGADQPGQALRRCSAAASLRWPATVILRQRRGAHRRYPSAPRSRCWRDRFRFRAPGRRSGHCRNARLPRAGAGEGLIASLPDPIEHIRCSHPDIPTGVATHTARAYQQVMPMPLPSPSSRVCLM